ncbi:hypothetical protein SAMN05880582_106124 [Rhizobium sp. RU20A]|nr:hypothetical protein SAMN05880582_106124 [Rhizobium sp. RU20A]
MRQMITRIASLARILAAAYLRRDRRSKSTGPSWA